MSIQYTVLGFEPSEHESPPITTRPRLPPSKVLLHYLVGFKDFSVEFSGQYYKHSTCVHELRL